MKLSNFNLIHSNLMKSKNILNRIIITNILSKYINNWKIQTEQELYKSSIQILLNMFEEKDYFFKGKLKSFDIENIIKIFRKKMKLDNLNILYISPMENKKLKYYTFYDLIDFIIQFKNIPNKINTILNDFKKHKISICLHCNKIMYEINSENIYTDNNAICDFTLEKSNGNLLHCSSERSIHHPYGFDIDTKHAQKYFDDLLNRRLETRINAYIQYNTTLKKTPQQIGWNIFLQTQKDLSSLLRDTTIVYYTSTRSDIRNGRYLLSNGHLEKLGEKTINILTHKLSEYKRILKKEDEWNVIMNTKLENIDNKIKLLLENINLELDLEKNIFLNTIDKSNRILNHRIEFKKRYSLLKQEIDNISELYLLLQDIELYTEIEGIDLQQYYNSIDDCIREFYELIESLENSTPVDNIISYSIVDNFENSSCTICLDNNTDIEISKIDNCDHIFHTSCIQRWLLANNSCPLCRNT